MNTTALTPTPRAALFSDAAWKRLSTGIIGRKRTTGVVATLRRLLAKEKRRQRKVAHTLAQLREQVSLLEVELQDSLCVEKRLTAQLHAVEEAQ